MPSKADVDKLKAKIKEAKKAIEKAHKAYADAKKAEKEADAKAKGAKEGTRAKDAAERAAEKAKEAREEAERKLREAAGEESSETKLRALVLLEYCDTRDKIREKIKSALGAAGHGWGFNPEVGDYETDGGVVLEGVSDTDLELGPNMEGSIEVDVDLPDEVVKSVQPGQGWSRVLGPSSGRRSLRSDIARFKSWGSIARASLEERIRIHALDDGSVSEGDVRLEVSLVTPADGSQPWGYGTVSAWVYVDGQWTGADALSRLGSQLERSGVLVDLSDGSLKLLGATGGRIPVSARLIVSNRTGDRSSHWGLVTGREWTAGSPPGGCECTSPAAKSEFVEPELGEVETAITEIRAAESARAVGSSASSEGAFEHRGAPPGAFSPAGDLSRGFPAERELEASTGRTIRMLVDETDGRDKGALTGTRKFP